MRLEMEQSLSVADTRRFHLQTLHIYAVGYTVWNAATEAEWNYVRDKVGGEAWDATGDAARIAMDAEWESVREMVREVTEEFSRSAAQDAKKKEEIIHTACRSVIANRKKIYEVVDRLKLTPPTTPIITVERATEICGTMMTFNDEQFAKLQLTIPLKMIDYLLGYEQAISFLRPYEQYDLLMEQHWTLVQRMGLERTYLELAISRETVDFLADCLPLFPLVLLEIVVGYCQLRVDDPDDLDEIYRRLLLLDGGS